MAEPRSSAHPSCAASSSSSLWGCHANTCPKFTSRREERKLLMDSNGAAAILLGGRQAALRRGKAASSSLALPRLFSLSLSGIPWGHSFKERKICNSTCDRRRREDEKPGSQCHQPGEPWVSRPVPWQQGMGLTHTPGTTCWPLQFAFCHREFQLFSHGTDKKNVSRVNKTSQKDARHLHGQDRLPLFLFPCMFVN